MGRIADLASGWAVDSESTPAPESPGRRDASGPVRAPRRGSKSVPPPPPGSAERQELEDKIAELTDDADPADAADDDDDSFDSLRSAPAPRLAGALPRAKRASPEPPRQAVRATGSTPPQARQDGAPIDLSAAPEADKTTENRGAVGIKHDASGSHTTNAASGTIGDDTPFPAFGRAGQKSVRVAGSYPTGAAPIRVSGAASGRTTGSSRVRPSEDADATTASFAPMRGGGDSDARTTAFAADRATEPEPPVRPSRPAITGDGPAGEPTPRSAIQRLAVPLGEFDHGEEIEQDKLRTAYSHATMKRDAAALGAAPPAAVGAKPAARQPPAAAMRPDVRFNDASGSSTSRFERGDQTDGELFGQPTKLYPGEASAAGEERGDATTLSAPSAGQAPAGGLLRSPAALPRRPGIAGDLRYPATVVFGVRSARRELAAIELRQVTRQQSRRHHLVTLGRTAVAMTESLDDDGSGAAAEHPALRAARDQLSEVEDQRSRHAGEVFAADSALSRVRGDREIQANQHVAELAALDAELAALTKQLAPLAKDAARIKKRVRNLHEALRRIDAKIAAVEAGLASGTSKLDPAAVQAELAMLRAERKAVQADEPVIAGELDALNPVIAELEAARAEVRRKRGERTDAEQEDRLRVDELLAAIGAQRKVVDRATAAAEARRDKLLFQLGEQLCVDRPDDLMSQLAPIDEIDVELGSADRRSMELREILTSVDHFKLARGIALLVVVLGALGGLTAWLLPRLL
jgi:cob(I)alamin adenosyltransferase